VKHLDPSVNEDGSTVFLWNIRKHLPSDAAPHPRRIESFLVVDIAYSQTCEVEVTLLTVYIPQMMYDNRSFKNVQLVVGL